MPTTDLTRFVKKRVDKIFVVSSPEAWNYVNTSVNPTDVGTRESSVKHADAVNLWLNGPVFLRIEGIEPRTQDTCPIVRVVTVNEKSLIDQGKSIFKPLIESCPDLYTLKKRAAYLTAFKEFVIAKAKKVAFKRPVVDASYLDTVADLGGDASPPTSLKVTILAEKSALILNNSAPFRMHPPHRPKRNESGRKISLNFGEDRFFFFFFFWRPPDFGRKKRLNFRFRPKNHSQFW